jgi:hypothetical protein
VVVPDAPAEDPAEVGAWVGVVPMPEPPVWPRSTSGPAHAPTVSTMTATVALTVDDRFDRGTPATVRGEGNAARVAAAR